MSARAGTVVAVLFALALPAFAADTPAPAATPSASTGASAAPALKAGAATSDDERIQPTVGDDRDVIQSSEKWLKLLDRGQLGPAWDISAKHLKAQVTRAEWVKGIGEARKPFGKLKARRSDRFARAHQMPGAPDGDYAIVQFETDFANGKHATEQITWMLEPDGGIWRVSGYYIR